MDRFAANLRALPTSITPRSYQDGVTYVEEMRALVDTLNGIRADIIAILESIPDTIDNILQGKLDDLTESVEAVNTRIVEVIIEMSDLRSDMDNAVREITESTIEITDPVVATIVQDENGVGRQAIIDLINEVISD